MKNLSKVHKADWKYVKADADPGFDPEHNQRVIDEVIRLNDLKKKQIDDEFHDQTQERVEDLTMFLKGVDMGGKNSDIDKYFGKKRVAYLRGEHIMSEMKKNLQIRNSAGKIIKRAGES